MRNIRILSITALAGLAACSTVSTGPDVELGAAVRNNIAVQTINPEPTYEGDAAVMADRPAIAVERYRADKVEKPVKTSTSNLGGDSGGSSGGDTPE